MNGVHPSHSVFPFFVIFFATLHAGRGMYAPGAEPGLPTVPTDESKVAGAVTGRLTDVSARAGLPTKSLAKLLISQFVGDPRSDASAGSETSAEREPKFNGDGRPAILLAPAELQGGSHRIAWYEAPADPKAGNSKQHVIEGPVETVIHALAVADFDGDGKLDLAALRLSAGGSYRRTVKCASTFLLQVGGFLRIGQNRRS